MVLDLSVSLKSELSMAEQDPTFTLDQLNIIVAIAQQGSFRRAADSLYISQPAVSLQVQNLERQLGVILFNRKGRQVQLTEAGQTLLEYSQRILTLCDEAVGAISDLHDLKRGSLKLGASQTVGTYVMPQLIGQFWQAYPQISVQLLVQSTRRIAQKLIQGEIDVAIVGGEIPEEYHSQLKILPYARDEFVLVTSSSFPEGVWLNSDLITPEVLEKADLARLQFITLDAKSTTRLVLDKVLEMSGVDPTSFPVQIELSSIEAIKTAIQAGLGVAFLSQTAVGLDIEQRRLTRLHVRKLEVKRTLWLAYNPERYQSRAAILFRKGLLTQTDWLTHLLPFLEPIEQDPVEAA